MQILIFLNEIDHCHHCASIVKIYKISNLIRYIQKITTYANKSIQIQQIRIFGNVAHDIDFWLVIKTNESNQKFEL